MSANILIQNELDENLTYSSRVGEFSSNSLWIKRLALISLLVLQFPLYTKPFVCYFRDGSDKRHYFFLVKKNKIIIISR